MNDDPQATAADDVPQDPGWQQALNDLERCLREASRAAALLRLSLGGAGLEARPVPAAPQEAGNSAPPKRAAQAEGGVALSTFDRLWDRIERERMEKQGEISSEPSSVRQGRDLLPHQYLVTLEDRESKVDLVSLHRALLNLAGIEDIALVSYTNGVPVISLRVEGELDLDQLGSAVSTAMDRQCEVIPQDSGKLYLRMKARRD